MRESMGRVLIAAVILFGILATGCAQTSKFGQGFAKVVRKSTLSALLNGVQLKQFLSQNVKMSVTRTKPSLGWYLPSPGGTGTITYRQDGTASLEVSGQSDKGTWRIQGDSLCHEWEKADKGRERCFLVHRRRGRFIFGVTAGEFKLFNPNGSFHANAKLLK